MSQVEVDKIIPQSGTTLTVGESGDTITVPSGATFDASNATTTLPATVVTTDGSQTLTNKTIDASQLTGTITPSDNTVSLAKLTATGTKDATTFLRGDNTFAEPSGGGITEADMWRITADITADVDPISSNWERVDNTGFGYLGTGMSVSSGVWTFPSTGIYLVMMNAKLFTSGGDLIGFQGHISIDGGSSYTQISTVLAKDRGNSGVQSSFYNQFFVDVTSTSLVKVKFVANSIASPSVIEGNTSVNETGASFIRLGDT